MTQTAETPAIRHLNVPLTGRQMKEHTGYKERMGCTSWAEYMDRVSNMMHEAVLDGRI